jgi:hypothetical protein
MTVWHGVRLVIEGRTCMCGATILRVRAVDGRCELHCERCDAKVGVLSSRTSDFLLAITRGYGAPTQPIVLRRPQQTNSARAESDPT